MKLTEIMTQLAYKAIVFPNDQGTCVNAYTSDLLSDVMGNAPEDSVLITIQGHKNTIAVASLVGIQAVILCNKRSAPDDMQEAAVHEGIAIFSTSDDQFTASCKIGELLHKDL